MSTDPPSGLGRLRRGRRPIDYGRAFAITALALLALLLSTRHC